MSTFEEQAAQRRAWVGRTCSLEESDEVHFTTLTVQERLIELYRLSRAAFAVSGKPFPTYRRADAPGRLLALEDDE